VDNGGDIDEEACEDGEGNARNKGPAEVRPCEKDEFEGEGTVEEKNVDDEEDADKTGEGGE